MREPNYFLEGLINNDIIVVKEIYRQSFYKVKHFVINNKGQREDAEDIFQMALMQLAVRYKKERFIIKTHFEAYLFTVCKNLWRRELNKSKNWVTKSDFSELNHENEDIALATLEQKRWELLTESLEKISENCNKVLKLYFSKMPYNKIMKQLNYNSENVVRQRVYKCKNKLIDLVKKDERFNSATYNEY